MPDEITDIIPEITRTDVRDTLVALGILLVGVVVARILRVVVAWLVRRAIVRVHADLAGVTIDAVRGPVTWLIVAQGLFLALRYPGYTERYDDWIVRLWVAVVVVIVTIGLTRVVTYSFGWYQARMVQPARLDPRAIPILRRATNIVIVALALLLVLDTVGLEITPLLAGLGIGGLAIALALQPVLANLFASSYMLSDSSIRVGDFIEVAGGPVGSVEHVGWRATRIRSFDNNIIMVPNAVLADSIFTNYSSSDRQADARLVFGVAYEEDLERVDDVVTDELLLLRDDFEASVPDADPIVRFQEFEDSNITVLVKLRALTWGDSFLLRHLMVKRLHARLAREGIEISYPARRLVVREDDMHGLDRFVGLGADTRGPALPERADERVD